MKVYFICMVRDGKVPAPSHSNIIPQIIRFHKKLYNIQVYYSNWSHNMYVYRTQRDSFKVYFYLYNFMLQNCI